mgnify:CR=1 FL=1|jgi:hypothetical protein
MGRSFFISLAGPVETPKLGVSTTMETLIAFLC